ncbi:glycosyltransferase family 4 protein [Aureibaculum sp. 2210JD6-5]|uniref:glycosyltransferase family 4 protein n=1 Tax=Aureibaculum sp. 2210JD6-5 TaxID=3103957 RepID=UPI002AADA8B7|nr:glycosyltransferase family 4 protein [Aureibaculum sp. 2210JD6-5]MDY7394085.1 glycosyltransferase family 4 protein [Aureibaculum sp. 2210JD6-5]
MKIYHIGVISFETKETKRELKAIGGIQGYIIELINFSLQKKISIGFVGKVYNFSKTEGFEYLEILKNVTSTNKFLIILFFKSFFIKLPKQSIIHAHRPDHFAAFTFFKNKPSIVTLHGQTARIINDRKGKLIRIIYNFLERFALKKANAILPVDEITKAYYLKLYPQFKNKLHVIPTGVNNEIFKPLDKQKAREKFGFLKTDKIILYVGRLEPPKKIEEIVKSLEILLKENLEYKLIFVGDGILLNEIKQLTTRLQLDSYITFLGIRKRNELPEIFNLADVSVLYSRNEGSPLSVKESLACGIPVVANCVGDIPLVIKNGHNGYLVENDSIDELAKKLELAIKKSAKLKQNCIDSIQHYTTEKVNQKVINIYKKILNEK